MEYRYNCLIHAIPKSWKKLILSPETIVDQEEEGDYKLIDRMLDDKQATKGMYNRLVGKNLKNQQTD